MEPRAKIGVLGRGAASIASAAVMLVAVGITWPASSWARGPNVLFFLVDDLGAMDVGVSNPHTFYETPHIDRLANSGMRFTNGYAANPVCSPSRFAIMTGRHPSRVKATNYFSGKRAGRFLPALLHDRMDLDEITIAELLQQAGYHTSFLGKWHLGPTAEYWPEHQGFAVNVGGHRRGAPAKGYFSPYANPRLPDGPPGEHLTERVTNEAISILEQVAGEPFFMYLAYYTVHVPLQAPEHLVQKYQAKAEALPTSDLPEFADEEQVWPVDDPRRVRAMQRHATYAAMVETLDTSVGRILAKLKELDLADNTVVCFTSDNGGLSTAEGSPTSNLPLRGGKGWLYEGGIREPFFIRWPGVTDAATTCDVPVGGLDFAPTLLEIAGITSRPDLHVDGVSLVPLLRGGNQLSRDALYWHYPHYSNQGGFPGAAIRRGQYKLIERFEDGALELYDLQSDVGERHNLADEMPDRVTEMRSTLHAWYDKVGATFLRAHPNGPAPWHPDAEVAQP